jgi:hypothetical protein
MRDRLWFFAKNMIQLRICLLTFRSRSRRRYCIEILLLTLTMLTILSIRRQTIYRQLFTLRVGMKISVIVFSRKFLENFFRFSRKRVRKVMKITKVSAKTFAVNYAGSENAVKHPNSEDEGMLWTNRSG